MSANDNDAMHLSASGSSKKRKKFGIMLKPMRS